MLQQHDKKQSAKFLSVKRIVVEQVGAVELLAVCLVHGDHVLLAAEYLNLVETEMNNPPKHIQLKTSLIM